MFTHLLAFPSCQLESWICNYSNLARYTAAKGRSWVRCMYMGNASLNHWQASVPDGFDSTLHLVCKVHKDIFVLIECLVWVRLIHFTLINYSFLIVCVDLAARTAIATCNPDIPRLKCAGSQNLLTILHISKCHEGARLFLHDPAYYPPSL